MDKTSESSVALGLRLKQLRQLSGLSQREWGRRAGVTNSNISMIEQGLISPSITSLERLLAVIPLSLEQFFTWKPEAAEGRVFRAESLLSVDGPGSGLRIQAVPPQASNPADDKPLSLERCILDPGSDTGVQCKMESRPILGWLLRGELQLSTGASVFSLAENDGFYLPALQLYRLRNLSDAEAILMLGRGAPNQFT